MKNIFLISLTFIVLISGCIGQADSMVVEKDGASKNASNFQLTAEKGDHVAVDYWGTLEDGTQFDTSEGRGVLEFDVGAGQMIKGFDDAVLGMKTNETKIVTISPKDGYGEKNSKIFQWQAG